MNIIEELYYGNLDPCGMRFKRGSEYDKVNLSILLDTFFSKF